MTATDLQAPAVIVPDRPHMPEAAGAMLEESLRASRCFLEYGIGGSTKLATSLGVPRIFSVESDRAWADAVREQVSGREGVDLDLAYANVGPTREWGGPRDNSQCAQWPGYVLDVWDRMAVRKAKPDLILIDGRFRLACFLATIIRAQEGARILFDDYAERPFYARTRKYLPIDTMADRMAVFTVGKSFNMARAASDLARACMDPR